MNHRLPSLLLLLAVAVPAWAQTCKVEDPDIASEYVGACKDGLADGLGVAKGRDEYRGMFQLGKKHGHGSYTWARGSRLEGEWKNDRPATGFGTYTIPVAAYDPAKMRQPIRGRVEGDVYIERGWREFDRLAILCGSEATCRQAVQLRQVRRQETEDAARRHDDSGVCARAPVDATGTTAPAAGFLGVWSGKWDGKWALQFSVAAGNKPGAFLVTYAWEETSYDPMETQLLSACIRDGQLVTDSGTLVLRLTGDTRQSAVLNGNFARPRTADMTRKPDNG